MAATDDFRGRLSDGWGEGASQRQILLGNEKVSIDFVLDEGSEFKLIEKKKKKKLGA